MVLFNNTAFCTSLYEWLHLSGTKAIYWIMCHKLLRYANWACTCIHQFTRTMCHFHWHVT